MAGTDRLVIKSQPTDPKKGGIIETTHITGGPVGAQRNNTLWIRRGLRRKIGAKSRFEHKRKVMG